MKLYLKTILAQLVFCSVTNTREKMMKSFSPSGLSASVAPEVLTDPHVV